jgi:hypothetical protein
MVRKAGHRHRVFALLAARQRKPKHAGRRLRVFLKKLVEVAHPKQQNRLRTGAFSLIVLSHHRGEFHAKYRKGGRRKAEGGGKRIGMQKDEK